MKKLIVVVLFLSSLGRARADELARLRAVYANEFLKPEAHLRLARHLNAGGDRLTAFFISEAARRNYFEEEEFDTAFRRVFQDDQFDNGPDAERLLREQVEAAPEDAVQRVKLADIFLSRSEWKAAEAELRKAIALAPDSFEYVTVLAEVLRRDGREPEAEKLQVEWLAKHPDSLAAHHARVGDLLQKNSPEAAKAVDLALQAYPRDARLHFQRAALLQSAGDLAGASKEFIEAADLDRDSAHIHGWTARFFLKAMNDPEKALHYYLNAYFLDPHFYDSEYAEGRVRSIQWTRAGERYAKDRAAGAAVSKLLADSDPVVVAMALEEADAKWSADLTPAVIALLGHDDPNNRAQAMTILGKHLQADDRRVDGLLENADLRVRGSAAYVAGTLRGEKVVPLMKAWLDSPADLIRYDAISVLAMHGGPAGRKVLADLRKSGMVREPRLRAILDAALKQKE